MIPAMSMSRRKFLASSGVAAACLATAASSEQAAADTAPAIIDCHAHIYSEDGKTYPIIEKPYRPPAGKGTITNLRHELKAAGVHSAAAVQTRTFYGWDNRFTADACRDNRDIITGVCLLNPEDPQSPALLERYVKEYNIRGLRFINNQKTGRLDEPGNNALLATCQRLGITACALINRDARSQLEALAARYPKLPIVIDHCLNLVAGKQYNAILGDMVVLAKVPNLYAKLSHVVTGSRRAISVSRHARLVPANHQSVRPRALRVGKRFPLRALVPEGELRPTSTRLHPRTRPRRRDKARDPVRNAAAARVCNLGLSLFRRTPRYRAAATRLPQSGSS